MLNAFNNIFNVVEIDWNNHSFHSDEEVVIDGSVSGGFDEEDTLFRPIKSQKVKYFSSPSSHASPYQPEESVSWKTQWVALSGLGGIRRRLFDDDEYSCNDDSFNSCLTTQEEYSDFSEEEVIPFPDFGEAMLVDVKQEELPIKEEEEWPVEVEGPTEEDKISQERLRFFTDKEPEQWFSLFSSENKITATIPSQIGRIKKLIYVFRNTENNKLLIGKTGQSFSDRLSGYKQAFNSDEVDLDEQEFIADVRKNPGQFEVGILHALTEEEDLNAFETQFIDCKEAVCSLYNRRKGGAGGLARSEEKPTFYAIPKDCPITPVKRYPYKTNKNGQIRLQLTPGFHRTVKKLSSSRTSPAQGFLYSIKSISSEKRYVGGTMQESPSDRLKQHGYGAEVYHSENEEKFDPKAKGGALHPAMGKNPLDFTAGFLPIRYDVESMSDEEKEKYHIVTTLGEAERKTIELVGSLVSKKGFNCNKGGGGPIADYKKRLLAVCKKRKIDEVLE
ncbi:Conserved hypothetical protein [Candidatus Protochlamydia naegleriophila]|uniref:Uncharacterized protein n=1 Tax=Candidatus Protochlamydia naegleriophila TaxID=389348 RepID=A0A0U5CN24_9BACT|nr:GIY-YIG nuclease family protein [Candidatus Protochlamydia naegleriophila]CUI16028.1 Conserved hypothetical protein [Candidatus Protochlamydia naegleriophila]